MHFDRTSPMTVCADSVVMSAMAAAVSTEQATSRCSRLRRSGDARGIFCNPAPEGDRNKCHVSHARRRHKGRRRRGARPPSSLAAPVHRRVLPARQGWRAAFLRVSVSLRVSVRTCARTRTLSHSQDMSAIHRSHFSPLTNARRELSRKCRRNKPLNTARPACAP
jgi:hypothetical protein